MKNIYSYNTKVTLSAVSNDKPSETSAQLNENMRFSVAGWMGPRRWVLIPPPTTRVAVD